MKLDKKCVLCPVRKFALKVVPILRVLYEQNQDIMEVLDEFETNAEDFTRANREVMYDNC